MIQAKHPKTRRKTRALLSVAAILTGTILQAQAGQAIAPAGKTVIERAPEANPLCFLDGKICFDFQERVRWEIRNNNFDFNDDINALTDDNWFLIRTRLGVMFKPLPWFKFYVQGQDSREWNSDRPDTPGALAAEGDDTVDLRQAYLELSDYSQAPIGLKIGRQILSYGDERLIGAFDWNNFGRTFDAAKLTVKGETWSLDAFAASVVVIQRGEFNSSDLLGGDERHREQLFSGLYFQSTAPSWGNFDLYALYLNQDYGNTTNVEGSFAPLPLLGVSGFKSSFVTLGGRIKGDPKKLHGFEFDGEAAYQVGEVNGLDLNAVAVHGGLGYNFDVAWKPRLYVEYNYASGDSDPFDGESETFQNLFPTNHKFYGYMDLFSWQNIHNPAISLRATPCAPVTVQLDYHAFWLASTDDVWYRANGIAAVRPVSSTAGNYAGSEIDLTVTWNVQKHLQIQAGYSHFFAGDYLADTGPNDDADFGYVQATVNF